MKIATVVSSNSHIDYVARVVDRHDAAEPPPPEAFGFGRFVRIEAADSAVVGVIYDSMLVNPDYASMGPRLSPPLALQVFSPDVLSEQGILVAILLLGSLDADGPGDHRVPHNVIPPGTEVAELSLADMVRFHRTDHGISVGYFGRLQAHAGRMALPLLEKIVETLGPEMSDIDRSKLDLLARDLRWQSTVAN